MDDILDLLGHFAAARSAEDGQRLLKHFVASQQAHLKPFDLARLLGRPPPSRVTVPTLKKALFDRIDPGFFEVSKPEASDLSEALSLLWPGGQERLDTGDLEKVLSEPRKATREEGVLALLDKTDARSRDLIIRVITGRFKPPTRPSVVRHALAEVYEKPLWEIEETLAQLETTNQDLITWLVGKGQRPDTAGAASFLSIPPIKPFEEGTDFKFTRAHVLPSGDFKVLSLQNDTATTFSLQGDLLTTASFDHSEDAILLVFQEAATPLFRAIDVIAVDAKDVRRLAWRDRHLLLERLIEDLGPLGLTIDAPLKVSDADELAGYLANRNFHQALAISEKAHLIAGENPYALLLPPPQKFLFLVLYAEGAVTKKGPFDGYLTLGSLEEGGEGSNEPSYLPVGKASAKTLSTTDQAELADFIRNHTLERYGPVRQLATSPLNRLLVEARVQKVENAPRRKAGLVLADPILERLVGQAPHDPITGLDELAALGHL